jgi:pyruvate dehydrogenase E2 component (dihydrolipoamide acetyltransferase)
MGELIQMPKLGFDMAEGTLVRWVIAEGEAVEKGQVLAEIETDKATVEVEALRGGVVHKHLVQEGTPIPVGDPIAVIADPGEDVDLKALLSASESADRSPATEPSAPPAPASVVATPAASPAPDREDGQFPAGIKASPVARRLAHETGLDLTVLSGTGPGGRVVKRDVERALSSVPRPAPGAQIEPGTTERVPLSKLRAAIGRRMLAAKQQLPHFYVTTDIAAGPLMEMRGEMNAILPDEEKITVNDFIVKAAARAMRAYPNLNASLEGDHIVRHGDIHIGIAVAVEDGLLTVVVKNADQKSLRQISRETREMASRARAGQVKADDVEGSTFTVSNLGMFDVDHFIAIINPPEAAILAVGSVQEVALVQDGQIKAGLRLKCTLSADHRVTDGAEAARWLQVFREHLEHPLRLVVNPQI